MVAWPVSRRANRPENDDPEVLRSLHSEGAPSTTFVPGKTET